MTDIVVNKIDKVVHTSKQGLTGAKGDKGDPGEGLEADLLAALQGGETPSADNPFVTQAIFVDTKDPTGFISPASVIVTGSVDRTVTLTGPLEYRWRGEAKELTAPWVSDPHPVGDGPHFLYSADGETFVWSTTVWTFDTMHVCRHYKGIYYRETHGTMPWQTHNNLHHHPNHGALRFSGGNILAGTYAIDTDGNAAVTPDFVEAVIIDEDLPSTVPAMAAGSYCHLYFSGLQVPEMATAQALPYRVGGTYPLINGSTAGTFADAEIVTTAVPATKRWFNVYQILAPVAADAPSQATRMMFLQPQFSYTSLAAAQAEALNALNLAGLGGFSPELVAYTRLTFETGSTFTATGKVRLAATATVTGKLNVSGTGSAATTAENVVTTPFDDIEAINQQATNEEIASKRVSITGSNRQLTAATGDEVAYSLDYTVNKATSGNDTGLLIKMTDTASPGTSYTIRVLTGAAGASEIFNLDNTGTITVKNRILAANGFGNGIANASLSLQSNQQVNIGTSAVDITTASYTTTSAVTRKLDLVTTYAQSGGAGSIDLNIVRVESSLGSGAHKFITCKAGASGVTELFSVSNKGATSTKALITNQRTVTDANATLAVDDYTLRMSTGASNRTVNLSAAVVGQIINIKKIDAGAGAVSFVGTSTCTIDGSTGRTLAAQYDRIRLQCVTAGADCVFDIL